MTRHHDISSLTLAPEGPSVGDVEEKAIHVAVFGDVDGGEQQNMWR